MNLIFSCTQNFLNFLKNGLQKCLQNMTRNEKCAKCTQAKLTRQLATRINQIGRDKLRFHGQNFWCCKNVNKSK